MSRALQQSSQRIKRSPRRSGERSRASGMVIKEIRQLHGEILSAARTSLQKAIRIGELLCRVRPRHKGEWLLWLRINVPFSDQTARNYIRVYENRDDPRFKTVLNLRDVYSLLCEPKSESEADDGKIVEMPGAASAHHEIIAKQLIAGYEELEAEATTESEIELARPQPAGGPPIECDCHSDRLLPRRLEAIFTALAGNIAEYDYKLAQRLALFIIAVDGEIGTTALKRLVGRVLGG